MGEFLGKKRVKVFRCLGRNHLESSHYILWCVFAFTPGDSSCESIRNCNWCEVVTLSVSRVKIRVSWLTRDNLVGTNTAVFSVLMCSPIRNFFVGRD